MKPVELFDLCMDAVKRWNSGDQIAEHPTVMLKVPLTRIPRGERFRLTGRDGPLGRMANIKEVPGGYEAVGFFNAVSILKWLGVDVRVGPSPTQGPRP